MEDNTVTKDDGWGQIDTSQPESKEKEDKVDFEVENSSQEKEVKVEPEIEKEEIKEKVSNSLNSLSVLLRKYVDLGLYKWCKTILYYLI